jgi:hypothetical protein
MLLAVPMEDRLGGMASPGMVDSVGRKATPHAGAAGQAVAQDRGARWAIRAVWAIAR